MNAASSSVCDPGASVGSGTVQSNPAETAVALHDAPLNTERLPSM
jgi:hypothetical protein